MPRSRRFCAITAYGCLTYTDPDGRNPCALYPQACAVAIVAVGSAIGAGLAQVWLNHEAGRPLLQHVGTTSAYAFRDGAAVALGTEVAAGWLTARATTAAAADAISASAKAEAQPGFIATSGGDVIAVPEGARGPSPTSSPGVQYTGGAGGM